jgi:lambda family phage portal protein
MSTALVPANITDRQLASLKQQGVPTIIIPQASFEGASRTRRMGNWGTGSAGPNSVLNFDLSTLRSRSRDFVRNHPLAQGAIDTYVSNLVGTGIVPRWKTNGLVTAELKERVQKRWLRWTDQSDAEGACDFYGQQALTARTVIESGSALIRRRVRRREDGMKVPLQLQVLEPDHLPHTMNQLSASGNEIQMGIEFDRIGRRAAYHMYRRHPGDQFFSGFDSALTTRVPAEDVIHTFRPMRPGQITGTPWLTSVLVSLYELDQYTDAERVRKKTAALFAAFVKSPASGGGEVDPLTGLPVQRSGNRDFVGLEPGTIQFLDPGEEVEFSAPADIGQNTIAWLQQQLREIATGIGITYEQLTGDGSQLTFSSIRFLVNEFRRRCEMLVFHLMVFQVCRPVIGWWMDALVMSGTEHIPNYWSNREEYLDVDWRGQGWEYVNPVDDRIAEQMDIRNGLDSRQGIVAKRGRDVEEVDREIKEDNDRADAAGLILDCDPRHTAKSGALQQAEDRAVSDSPDSGRNQGGTK